jgi:hypothetical protein
MCLRFCLRSRVFSSLRSSFFFFFGSFEPSSYAGIAIKVYASDFALLFLVVRLVVFELFRVHLEVQHELAGGEDHLRVFAQTAGGDGIHSFVVGPNASSIQLDHEQQSGLRCLVSVVFDEVVHEVLQSGIDVLRMENIGYRVLFVGVHLLDVLHDGCEEQLAQFFVVAAEQLHK